MKEDSYNFEISPELESRIVALVLGEASDLERDQLQQLLDEHPQLARIKTQFEAVHGLLCEVGADESDVSIGDGDEWKLPAERRRALLAVLDGRMSDVGTEIPAPEISHVLLPDKKQGIWRLANATAAWRRDEPHSEHRNFWGLSKSTAALVVAGCIGTLAVTGFLFFNASRSLQRNYQLATREEAARSAVDVSEGFMRKGVVVTPQVHFRGGTETEFLIPETQPSATVDFTTDRQNSAASLLAIRESLRGDQSLPSPYYLNDDVQYFPAGPESPLARSYVVPVPEEPAIKESIAGAAGRTFSTAPGSTWSMQSVSPEKPMSGPVATTESVSSVDAMQLDSLSGDWDDAKANVGASDLAETQRPEATEELPALASRTETFSDEKTAIAPGEKDSGLDRRGRNSVQGLGTQAVDSLGYRFSINPENGLEEGEGISNNGNHFDLPDLDDDLDGEMKNDEKTDLSRQWLKLERPLEEQSLGRRLSGGGANDWFESDGREQLLQSAPIENGRVAGRQSSVEDSRLFGNAGAGGAGYPLPDLANEPQSSVEEVRKMDGLEDRVSAMSAPAASEKFLKQSVVDLELANGEVKTANQDLAAKKEAVLSLPQGALLGKESLAFTDEASPSALSPLWESKLESAEVARSKKLVSPVLLEEANATDEPFSTFSLHVSDVSFKLAQAALAQGTWPQADTVRVEEFVNAFDYGDPLPSQDEKVACRVEQAIHPFLQQRNVLRVSLRTAAQGRAVNTPLRITLLLDNSGSMERIDRRQTVHRAFALLAQQLSPIDQVTLISFARQPRLLADKVSGEQAQQLVGMIEDLPSEGGTNIEAALQLAFEKAQEQHTDGAQNRIVLLTDGAVNLGDANPQSLSRKIVMMRDAGIAFDAAGISADGLNDEVLEALTRQGDGRYYLLDSQEAVDDGFARQIAGALRPSAKNVKVQIEFNPNRVGRYKLLGFEKHLLKPEDFRDDGVDAAEMAAAEAGVAVYQFEAKPDGEGDVGSVSVRFLDLSTGQMVENRWPIPYEPGAVRIEQAAPALRIATSAALFAAKLRGEPLGEQVDLKILGAIVSELPDRERAAKRIEQFQRMIEQSQQISGN